MDFYRYLGCVEEVGSENVKGWRVVGVLGAFIVMVATAMQSQLDVAEIWAWQRVSKKIAPEMVDQAIPKGKCFSRGRGTKNQIGSHGYLKM